MNEKFYTTFEATLRSAKIDKISISSMLQNQGDLLKSVNSEKDPIRYAHELRVFDIIRKVGSDTL